MLIYYNHFRYLNPKWSKSLLLPVPARLFLDFCIVDFRKYKRECIVSYDIQILSNIVNCNLISQVPSLYAPDIAYIPVWTRMLCNGRCTNSDECTFWGHFPYGIWYFGVKFTQDSRICATAVARASHKSSTFVAQIPGIYRMTIFVQRLLHSSHPVKYVWQFIIEINAKVWVWHPEK